MKYLDCPFCDSENVSLARGHFNECQVICNDCNACGPSLRGESNAIKAWNEVARRIQKVKKKESEGEDGK